jgi:hypothetical protein
MDITLKIEKMFGNRVIEEREGSEEATKHKNKYVRGLVRCLAAPSCKCTVLTA